MVKLIVLLALGCVSTVHAQEVVTETTSETNADVPVIEPDEDSSTGGTVDPRLQEGFVAEDEEELSLGLTADKSLEDVVTEVFEFARRRNIRQRTLKRVWRPFFLEMEDVDSFMVLLSRKSLETRWLRDRFFAWDIEHIEIDEAYGFGEVEVSLWGISRFWLPRKNVIQLSATKIEGAWHLRGPELVDIDIRTK